MEIAMKVRHRVLVQAQSMRKVARETGLSRNTIRKYCLDESPPQYERQKPQFSPKLNDYQAQLSQWFEDDLKRPKRERRNATKLFEQLIMEGYQGSYSPVCRWIKKLKSTQSSTEDAFIPLVFKPGDAMQFDWSMEVVVLDGIEQKIKVAHFRLSHSRKSFVVAYPRETQEMLIDAFVQALTFYKGVPKRVLIDNPKTMVVRIGKGKEREFHPRFLALMNHYLIDPVACTPASGWEKGQVENQVNVLRNQLFKPQLRFDSLDDLNQYLSLCCDQLGQKTHPVDKDKTIDEVFEQERLMLRPVGRDFDGYVEKTIRVSSTCLVQYDTNHYSVPCQWAKQRISCRIYANKLVMVAEQQVIATHKRSFKKHAYWFEPWHYVTLLKKKPGALRNGAPFEYWDLPKAIVIIKKKYLQRIHGDRDFVELLLLIQTQGMDTVAMACELAIDEKTTHLSAIINRVHRMNDIDIKPLDDSLHYPQLKVPPQANCERYNRLLSDTQAMQMQEVCL
jgi:transposase